MHDKQLARVELKRIFCPNTRHTPIMLLFLLFLGYLQWSYAQKEDFYKILGVPKDAKLKDIKRVQSHLYQFLIMFQAFRKEGAKWHPDKAPEGQKDEYHQRFSRITEGMIIFCKPNRLAYSVLGDEQKRAEYDMQSQGLRGYGGGNGGAFTFNFGDMFARGGQKKGKGRSGGVGGIFEQMFGGGSAGMKFNSNFGAGNSILAFIINL